MKRVGIAHPTALLLFTTKTYALSTKLRQSELSARISNLCPDVTVRKFCHVLMYSSRVNVSFGSNTALAVLPMYLPKKSGQIRLVWVSNSVSQQQRDAFS